MPVPGRLQREFSSRGLAIIGVNARESKKAVGRYAEELDLTFPRVLEPGGEINAQYGVMALSTTFVASGGLGAPSPLPSDLASTRLRRPARSSKHCWPKPAPGSAAQ